MSAKIFIGKVLHSRTTPKKHTFTYPIYWYTVDLDLLPNISAVSFLFSYNKKNLVSIFDKDYIDSSNRPLKEKLFELLKQNGINNAHSATLITSGRYFNYVFNPVSFYYCYDKSGELLAVVTEINNTFKERHIYILSNPYKQTERLVSYKQDKEFHVSPFFDVSGEYTMSFSPITEDLDIKINLAHDGKQSFVSRMWGKGKLLSTANILKTLLKYPLTASLTIPRIYFEAARLHFLRGFAIITKPNPKSSKTLQNMKPTLIEKLGIKVSESFFSKINRGLLTITYPDGTKHTYGGDDGTWNADIRLKNYYPFGKVLRHGGIGFGESYVDGDWETDDLSSILSLFLNNYHVINEKNLQLAKPMRFLGRISHWLKKNSLLGSQKNISAHYDLSNELFSLFLDPSLTYSCGIYNKNVSLEDAQKAKTQSILNKASINEGDRILEIGSGWGTLAIEAVKNFNCNVKSISLSNEQLSVARERAEKAGVKSKVNFAYEDYRRTEGSFDKIISVEMLEAVGRKYLPEYFFTIDKLLSSTGSAVIQVIASPDSWYEDYCTRQDWIQKYIFPGSHLPCLSEMLKAIKEKTSLVVESIEDIGPHYAPTLHEWRLRFDSKISEVKKLGFDDRFCRLWRFYLASCEAEFATRWLSVYQIVLTKQNNQLKITEYMKNFPKSKINTADQKLKLVS